MKNNKAAEEYLKERQIKDIAFMSWSGNLSQLLTDFAASEIERQKHKYRILARVINYLKSLKDNG